MSFVLKRVQQWLLPYQRRWLADTSKWKICLKGRQEGYTEVCALEALLHAIKHPGHDCYLVSSLRDNAAKILRRVKERWIPSLKLDPAFAQVLELEKDNTYEIRLANGSSIYAVANDPDKLRGNPGSYWFDEFDWWETSKLEKIEGAVWPSIKSPLGQNKYNVLRIISTPLSKGRLYHHIWTNKDGKHGQFSRHYTDIYKAVREGLPFDIEKERASMPHDKWRREYECAFEDFGGGYFDRDKLLALELEPTAIPAWAPTDTTAGVDLGKINDFSSIVFRQVLPVGVIYRDAHFMRQVNYARQLDAIADLIRADKDVAKIGADCTAHKAFGDFLREHFPAHVYEWHGNNAVKNRVVEGLRQEVDQEKARFAFERSRIFDREARAWKPYPGKPLLNDLSKVQQLQTASGKIKYDAPRDGNTGHADSWSATIISKWVSGMAATTPDTEVIAAGGSRLGSGDF